MSVEVHDVTRLYNGKIFDVVLEKVTLPNGVGCCGDGAYSG